MKDYANRGADIERWMAEIWPRTLQANVRILDDYVNAKRCVVRLDGVLLSVIVEVECHDSQLWTHLSVGCATKKRVPSWDEMRWCKDYFIGDRKAIQVLPPRSEYVNINPYVLHLFAALERDPLPDFRHQDAEGNVGI